jgi:hypothetical protein
MTEKRYITVLLFTFAAAFAALCKLAAEANP